MTPPATIRVLHLRNSDFVGGPERLILDQCALRLPTVEPILSSCGRAGAPHPFLDEAARLGVKVRLISQSGSYDPRLVRRLRRVIREVDPEVIVGHDYKSDLLIRWASVFARRRPFVAVVHGYTGQTRLISAFERVDRRILRRAQAVVAVSVPMRDALAAAGVARERIHVIENAVSVDRVAGAARAGREVIRRAWGIRDGEFVVLSLGRLSPEKGQDILLEAFAARDLRAGTPPLRLALVGDGALRASLEARAGEYTAAGALASDAVLFLGWRTDPWACLGAADLLALPSRREGLPLALLEAMAARVPVVATDAGGVGLALDCGRCGILIPPEDPAALAAAIRSLALDPRRREALAAAAEARVRAHYGTERQARELARVYSDAAAGG